MANEYEQYYVEEPKKTWQTAAIVAGAVVVGVVVIILAVVLVRSVRQGWQGNQAEQNIVERVEQRIEDSLEDCEDTADPEQCQARLIQNEAEGGGGLVICEMLEGEDFDDCVFGLARDQENVAWCDYIDEEEDKLVCQSDLILLEARATTDYSLCETIPLEEWKESCQTQLLVIVLDNGTCETSGVDLETCQFHSTIEQATVEGDLETCERYEEEYPGICFATVYQADNDDDGLRLWQEEEYGTSDFDPDSDNDGYGDWNEVQAGYNPAGEGVL